VQRKVRASGLGRGVCEDASLTATVNPYDGHIMSNFIVQVLRGEDLTVYGDSMQTRSFQYIHDLVDSLIVLMSSGETCPVNLGNGDEFTILEFAHLVCDIVEDIQRIDGIPLSHRVNTIHEGLPKDDPQKRRPDTSHAKAVLEGEGTVGGGGAVARSQH